MTIRRRDRSSWGAHTLVKGQRRFLHILNMFNCLLRANDQLIHTEYACIVWIRPQVALCGKTLFLPKCLGIHQSQCIWCHHWSIKIWFAKENARYLLSSCFWIVVLICVYQAICPVKRSLKKQNYFLFRPLIWLFWDVHMDVWRHLCPIFQSVKLW